MSLSDRATDRSELDAEDESRLDAVESSVSDASEADRASSDAAGSDANVDAAAPARLVHRYDFGGFGTAVIDSVGGANGTVIGGPELGLDGSGKLTFPLNNMTEYVDLPNGLLSRLRSATILV